MLISILVVDKHNNVERVKNLVAVLKTIKEEHLIESISTFTDKKQLDDDDKTNITERFVTFIHGGYGQDLLFEVLHDPVFKNSRFILYHGGTLSPIADSYFEDKSSSNKHAYIKEAFDLKGLNIEQKESVKKCVELLIKNPDMSTQEAVEKSFRRPELNEILKELYEMLYRDDKIEKIIKERDEKLNNYFRKLEDGYTE